MNRIVSIRSRLVCFGNLTKAQNLQALDTEIALKHCSEAVRTLLLRAVQPA